MVGVGLGAGAAVVVAGATAVAGDGAPAQRAVADVAAPLQHAAVRFGRSRPELPLRVLPAALGHGAPALPAAGAGEEAELQVIPASDGRGGGRQRRDGEHEEEQHEALHAGHGAAARENECAWGKGAHSEALAGLVRREERREVGERDKGRLGSGGGETGEIERGPNPAQPRAK